MTSETKNLAHARIGQIAVTAHDIERAVAFYRDKLGLHFLFQADDMAFLQVGEVRLMLGVPEKPEQDHPSSIIYFKVGDIEGSHRQLREAGVEFRTEPQVVHRTERFDLWMAFFRDSEGNTHALMSEVPPT